MPPSVLLILLVSLTLLRKGANGSSVLDDWNRILTVDISCPRYLYFDNMRDGLGDQLERFYMVLALAYKYRKFNITVIAPDHFGEVSIHYDSYTSIIQNILGLPTKELIFFDHFVGSGKYEYTKTARWASRDQRLYNLPQLTNYLSPNTTFGEEIPRFIKKYPCYDYHEVSIYDSCGKWCPLFLGDEIWKAVHTLIEETYVAAGSRCHTQAPSDVLSFLEEHSINRTKAITFMIHLRFKSNSHDSFSEKLCHHCKDDYLKTLWSTMENIANTQQRPFQVVVIHRTLKDRKHNAIKFLDQYPQQVVYYTEEKLEHVACMFAQADVLITTGSSLPSMISWSFPMHSPILIEERRLLNEKEFDSTKIRYHHVTSNEKAFHMVNGTLIDNDDSSAIRRVGAILSDKYKDNKSEQEEKEEKEKEKEKEKED